METVPGVIRHALAAHFWHGYLLIFHGAGRKVYCVLLFHNVIILRTQEIIMHKNSIVKKCLILGGKNIPTYIRCRKMLEYWCSNGQDGNWKDVIHTSFDKFQRKVLEIALLCCGPEIYISMLDNDSQGHKLEMIVMWSIKFWPEPWLMIASTSKFILGEICKSNIRCWIFSESEYSKV